MDAMSSRERKVLHEPNLSTIMMVEKTILDADDYMTKMELWKALPRKVQYQTFQRILEYLENSGKITYNDPVILWIGTENPKFKAMLESCVRVR